MSALSAWPSDRLVALARMLNRAFPRDSEAEDWSGGVTSGRELKELRASIPRLLFQRGPGADRQSLEELVDEFDFLRNWFEYAKADEAAHGELARVSAAVPGAAPLSGPLPVQSILDLLDNADYRVVRNSNDLVEVVEDLLQKIDGQIGEHVEMLYCGVNTKKGPQPQHESALQSYVHCRLSDLLPRRILDEGTKVSMHREPQGHFRKRTDIEIVAPLVHGGLGTLVIEVKWSHNNDIAISQIDQLGTDYLLKAGKTHGIYLVGWTGRLGRWPKTSGPRLKTPVTAPSLCAALAAQASAFCQNHPGIHVRPLVFDLDWPERA